MGCHIPAHVLTGQRFRGVEESDNVNPGHCQLSAHIGLQKRVASEDYWKKANTQNREAHRHKQ